MTRQTIYYYTLEVIKIIQYYIDSYHPSDKHYQKGLLKIETLIHNFLSNIQNVYYQYILKDDLIYQQLNL
jgi:hypothetical protein